MRAIRIETELGIERLCRRCDEYWPEDDSFWFFQDGKVMGHCKACWSERIFVDGHRVWPVSA